VKARNDPIHTKSYEDKWIALRERVDTVMCEFQNLSIEAHYKSLINWFKKFIYNMKEVEVNRFKAKSRLYILNSPFFLDASAIITSGDQENLDLSWLTNLKIQPKTSTLEKLE